MNDKRLADQLAVFAGLWAVGHIAHVLRKGAFANPASWALLACCLLLLGRPRSRTRLSLLALAQLWLLASTMPFTDNHLYIMGFVNAGLLAAFVPPRWRGRDPSGRPPDTAPPFARLTLLLGYSAAAFAKLNHGFFDPGRSCGVRMFYDAADVFGATRPFLPRQIEAFLPVLIAGMELAVPLLLIVRTTRIGGVVVAVLFHFAMSLSPTATAVDFTLVLFALVFLFLPAPAAVLVLKRLHQLRASIPPRWSGSPAVTRAAGLFAFCFLGAMLVFHSASVARSHNWLLLAPTAVLVGGALIHLAWTLRDMTATNTLSWRISRLQGALILLLLVNISAPYLGLKTTGTFTMYSNLQTADRRSNHFIVPRGPFETRQDDLVRVVASSDSGLKRIGERGSYITWHELRRRLSRHPEASISYVRNDGELVTLAKAREDPALVSRDRVLHWLIGYRDYNPFRATCRW